MSDADFLSGSRAKTVIPLPQRGNLRLRITPVVILLALALVAGAHWILSDSTLPSTSAAAQTPAATGDTDFVYFPSLYLNQGTEPTEPTPTF